MLIWTEHSGDVADGRSGRARVLRLYLLLLVLQELLLLVVLDLLDLLQLLELTLLLESQLLLLRRQEVSLSVVPIRPNHVGARRWRRHAGGVAVDGFPGIGGREAVVALGDIGVRPHLC